MNTVRRISTSRPKSIEGARVQELLAFVGLPRKVVYRSIRNGRPVGAFWARYAGRLNFVLYDARHCWLTSIKNAHPDNQGSLKRAAALNAAWSRIQKLFAQKGATL